MQAKITTAKPASNVKCLVEKKNLNNFSTNLLALRRQQLLLLTCDLINTPARGFYDKLLLFLFTGPWNIQISFIYILIWMNIKVNLHAWSATCDPMLELILNAFISRCQLAWWTFLIIRWNRWWQTLFLFFEEKHDFPLRPPFWFYNPSLSTRKIISFVVTLLFFSIHFCWLLHLSPSRVKWNFSNLIFIRNTLNNFFTIS